MGAAVAAIIIRKEKDLVAHFRQAKAVDAAHARTASELGVDQRLAWNILVRHAVLREASPGTWYLDEPTWEALRSRRRRVAMVIIVAVLLLGLASFLAVKR